jgi:diadenosine tetraphosphatase ApaH/serine/threonine PP2A family protein phosphatase
MLIGIVTDIHANLEAAVAVFDELDTVKPDKIVCLGDVAGYNANPNEVIDMVRERGIPTVLGNHDAAACGLEEPWFFNEKAKAAIEWQSDRLRRDNREWLASLPGNIQFDGFCLGVHGAPGNRDDYILDWLDAMRQIEFLDCSDAKVCFFGHSHLPSLFGEKGGTPSGDTPYRYSLNRHNRYFINPGSVGQPRDRDPRAAFGLFELETLTFEFRRVEYDMYSAARRIAEAGLPTELAVRLTRGR